MTFNHLNMTLLNLSLVFLKLAIPWLTFTHLSVALSLPYLCLSIPPGTANKTLANVDQPHQNLDYTLCYRHRTVIAPSVIIFSWFTQKSVVNRDQFCRELPPFRTMNVRRPLYAALSCTSFETWSVSKA